MFFLAGLLGMMVIGSVAMVTTAEPEPEEDDPMAEGSEASGPEDHPSFFQQIGLTGAGGMIAEGDDGDDDLAGGPETDHLGGAAGDDVIDGASSDDELTGGSGADTLLGGDGADTLHGEADADHLEGGAGADALFGHDGDDALQGGADDDTLHGGMGHDGMAGDAGDDALHGREGFDTLDGGPGQDTLFGGWDNDLLNGVERDATGADTDLRDYLNGGDGADTLAVGSDDIATGGSGPDAFILGHWITGAAAELADYDAAEDQIVVVYDDSTGIDPEVVLRLSDADPAVTELLLDGQVISILQTAGAPSLDGIVLVPESTAQTLGIG